MESEEREAATGRSQNVVHILPQSMDSVPRFLTGPLERVDPAAGGTQLLLVSNDAESAVTLAEAALRLTGLGGIELFPVTTARRAVRLMQGRPVLAIAGAPADLADLIRGSHLKLHDVRTLVVAWADDVLEGDAEANASLELVMTELPKDAARIVVTDRADKQLDAFVERYLRRARRMDEQPPTGDTEPVALRYVTVSPASRPAALRRLLDELDPPSAAVIAGAGDSAEVSTLLRTLGHSGETEIKVITGEIVPHTHAVIFYGMPTNRQQLAAAAAAGPVAIVALIQPRELKALRRLARGEVRPLTLSSAGKTARECERTVRRELATVLESGLPAREILALEPLLEIYDGIEIAAAALRLLEKERAVRKSVDTAPVSASPSAAPRAGGFERGGRPPRDREGRSPREFRDSGPPVRRGGRPPSQRNRPPGTRPDSGGRPPRDRS